MDTVDFQEKMNPIHRINLCRMLRMEQLPECLLKEYLKAKKMVDIIDGSLTVGEMAILALRAGYNPDTGKFLSLDDFSLTREGIKEDLQAVSNELAEKPSVGQTLAESDDKVIEEAVEAPVEPPVDEPESDEQKPDLPAPTAKLWSPGMPVRALHDEEFKLGKIVGVSKPSEVGKEIGAAVQLTVELEGGDTVTVEESECEAI